MRGAKALWARLSVLTWGELPYRVREQVRRQVDRAARPPTGVALRTWPVEVALDMNQWSALWRQADRILEDGVPVPGGRVAGALEWSVCPRTGHDWGTGYAFDVDVFAGVDPRASWALHRLRHLQTLAVAAAAGHKGADAAVREQVGSWIAENPPLTGIGWASGIEVASRAVSLLVVAGTVAADWDEPARQALADSLEAHRWFLERHPSEHSSANNHAVAELGARVLLGDPVADRFEERFCALVREDGSGVEEAPAYLATCVEWALIVRSAGKLGARAEGRLGAAGRFLGGLVDGLGRSPALGDSDGDGVLAGPLTRWAFELAGLVASALERPEDCPVAWTPELRGALLGIWRCEGTRLPQTGVVGGGLVRLVAGTDVAWLDRGVLGMPPMAAHGHADALSVCYHRGVRRVLVDSGTGTYLGDLDWRRWVRGAGAHNGLVVDGEDPVEQLGPFQWAAEPEGLWQRTWVAPERGEAGGVWLGWPGLVWTRRVRLTEAGLEIVDRVEAVDGSAGPRMLALPLHFAPELRVAEEGEGWRVSFEQHTVARVGLERPGMAVRRIRGGEPAGFVALNSGDPVEADCLWSEGVVGLPWEGRALVVG